jgi:glucokinase
VPLDTGLRRYDAVAIFCGAGFGMTLRIGIDVGGTNLRVGVVRQCEVMWEHRHTADFSHICRSNTPSQALEKIISELAAAIEQARQKYPGITSVGIGFPGFIDPATGIVSLSPNLPGLANVDIAKPLAQRLQLPVTFENDALCAAYGEYLLAQPRPVSLIYLGLGTGVGGGLILNGKSYPGQHGVAMEVGHLIMQPGGRPCGCGNRGCLEQYASASGVALSYQELAGIELASGQIAALAAQGDAHAVEAFRFAAETLAAALAHILKVVDVGTVVIGGGLSASWPLLQKQFSAYLDAELIPALRGRINVTLAQAGDQAGMLGAAMLAGG